MREEEEGGELMFADVFCLRIHLQLSQWLKTPRGLFFNPGLNAAPIALTGRSDLIAAEISTAAAAFHHTSTEVHGV